MSRTRKLRTTVFVIAGLILLLAVAHFGTLFHYSRHVDGELDRLRRAGKPITAAELAGDPIPDEDNAALVYLDIFSMIPKSDGDIFGEFLLPGKRDPEPELWRQAEQAVERNKSAFALLPEAESRPQCRYPTNWEDGLRTLFKYLADLRSFARALGSKAVVEAKAGDMDACVSSLRSSYLLAESIKEEPALIHFLTRLAVMSIAQDALVRASEYGTFNEDQARIVFDTLSRVDLRKGLVTVLDGERAMVLSVFDELRGRRLQLPEIKNLVGGSAPVSAVGVYHVLTRAGLGGPLIRADEAAYLRVVEKQIQSVKLPYREIKAKGLHGKERDVPRYAVTTDLMAQIYSHFSRRCDTGQASIGLTQAFLALQAYRDRYGAYPASLADVEKSLGWELPDDPFSGKPFVYDLKDDDFTLYSIGPDVKDDGGLPSEPPHETGDIVWGKRAPKKEPAQDTPPPANP